MRNPEYTRAMVIDDQRASRAMVRLALSDLGFRDIGDFDNGRTALEAMRESRFHLVISDYRMPGYTGLDLLKDMRSDSRLRNTAVIMLTASAERETVQQAVGLNVAGYIVKPFGIGHLKERVVKVLSTLPDEAQMS